MIMRRPGIASASMTLACIRGMLGLAVSSTRSAWASSLRFSTIGVFSTMRPFSWR
ncbi:hypothetical protein D3C83_287140 [compost metagenome]